MHPHPSQSHRPLPPLLPLPRSTAERIRGLLLEQLSYQPRSLLQKTMQISDSMDLCESTKNTIDDFVYFFRGRVYEPVVTEERLQSLMQYLDDLFFSGILTRDHRGPMVELEFRDNIFNQIDKLDEKDRVIWGQTTEVNVGNTSALRMKIEVDATHPRRREGFIVKRELMDVLETLVHEMAHAYLMLFACRCESCEMDTGVTGHGPVWQELKQVMYMTIRQWDSSLWNFYADDWDQLD